MEQTAAPGNLASIKQVVARRLGFRSRQAWGTFEKAWIKASAGEAGAARLAVDIAEVASINGSRKGGPAVTHAPRWRASIHVGPAKRGRAITAGCCHVGAE
jgi:hypothetical protein